MAKCLSVSYGAGFPLGCNLRYALFSPIGTFTAATVPNTVMSTARLIALFVFALTLFSAALAQAPLHSTELNDFAYSVLSTYFRIQLAGKNSSDDIRIGQPGSVLAPMTMRWRVPLPADDKDWLKRDLKGIDGTTIASFEMCADTSVSVRSQFSLPTPYVIARKDEISSVAKLYTKYPKTWGVVRFSCVGTNPEQNQALFFIERDKCHCGVGKFVFLEKNRAGDWEFKAELVRWIS
jgi:hypothetical protein